MRQSIHLGKLYGFSFRAESHCFPLNTGCTGFRLIFMHVPSSKCDAPSPKKNQFFLEGYLNIITTEIQTKTSHLPISISQEDTILYGSMPSNWNRVSRNELIKLLSSVFYLSIRLKYNVAPPKSEKGTRINTVCSYF